ncbi:MAG: FG-GAP-like repeat-containing protein [Verrucomicrobiales bacterium]|nr:FG-GAP-like repeat-containing protein [Verrucomicrobiales bacterium]
MSPPTVNLLFCRAAWFALPIFFIALATFVACTGKKEAAGDGNEFVRLMNVGKSLYEKGDAAKAVETFEKAVPLAPTHIDARLNLANAYLLAGRANEAILQAQECLKLDPKSATAYYIQGCSLLRLSKFDEAIQSLQSAKNYDVTVNPVSFQLGRAFQGGAKLEDALREFKEVIDYETNKVSPLSLAAQYNTGQILVRLGRVDEANQALEEHRKLLAQRGNAPPTDVSTYERSVYTEARVPFVLEQPDMTGIKVEFSDATESFFAGTAKNFRGPVGVIDINHRGANDLFLREGEASFRLLMNETGKFTPRGEALPVTAGAHYSRVLVGDLATDRNEDVIVIGDKGIHAFRFATNGAITEATAFAGLKSQPGTEGALVDLDFTGKLDLLLVPPGSNAVRVLRNLGNMYFKDSTATSGVPALVNRPRQLTIEDWNNDDIMDVFVARENEVPLLLIKERGGALTISNLPAQWPAAQAIATGDLNNDLRADLVLAGADRIECVFNGLTNNLRLPLGTFRVETLTLIDYDNDGWLDILAAGQGLRVWRNLGQSGFRDASLDLGLDKLVKGKVEEVVAADFDSDCDTDLLLSLDAQGLQMLRNEGGNANKQLKLQLMGNRSNPSGLGVRVEVTAGNWRTLRTVQRLPVEIGAGQHVQLDSVTVRWADLAFPQAEVDMKSCGVLAMIEYTLPTGSCPYLYAWDGKRFRFVTDILGASPVGLPIAEGRYIEADPDEFVWIGNENTFAPQADSYLLQITEELREVLYLDEAKLFVVDHPVGIEIYPTDKLLPGKPFPASELVALHRAKPLLRAARGDGLDVTDLLKEADTQVVSPTKLRAPQLRGLAEPHSVTLDFGPLEAERPLVLGLTGWLRFGGGMANISASRDPTLPFPFPVLEVQTSADTWQKVEVAVGAPAGKTKRLFVDLTGKLPSGSRLLRLNAAFEIHWDQAVLFEKATGATVRQVALTPDKSDLHWRGFSGFSDLPWNQPLTPIYDTVYAQANWRVTLSGWCTRYGSVTELIAQRDDALALLNGGDELTLSFSAKTLPPKPTGYVRDFFLYTVGWDKDADFHVKLGSKVEPLPYIGMDDQRYGDRSRPEHLRAADALMEKFNTRWVGPVTLSRKK